jgi:hypothetical protein
MPVQLSTGLRTFAAEDPKDWSSLVEFARAADEAGIDRLVLSDHVVFGENLDAYGDPAIGGSRGGEQPTGPDGAWLDPITTIAHLTAVTSRVRFATNILIAALRRPVVLAKAAATIDVASGGNVRSTRRRASRSRAGAGCSTTPLRSARRCGATRRPTMTATSSRSPISIRCPSRPKRVGCRSGSAAP